MKVLLKRAKIVTKTSPFRDSIKDILIADGIIIEISDLIEKDADLIITSPNLMVSIGWIDMGCNLCDPGYEFKEDLETGTRAALKGGFSDIVCLPNTKPSIQSKENVYYILSKARELPVNIHVIAAATDQSEGKQMTEIHDLYHAGAVGFSDGGCTIQDSGMMVRLMQYLNPLNALLIVHSEDTKLSKHGVMHEGAQSVYLGQKGIPAVSEEVIVERNIQLLKYAGGRLHLSRISTAGAIERIKQAKEQGLNITCDVAVANLAFNDTFLTSFDTNYKTNPPLRSAEDQNSLWNGVKDGTVDVIITDHSPQDEESKSLEFDLAESGMIQLESAFSLLNNTRTKDVSIVDLLELITVNPRKLLGLPLPVLETGNIANLTVFDPDLEWAYNSTLSKSVNSPVLGEKLKGKALAVFTKGQFIDLRN